MSNLQDSDQTSNVPETAVIIRCRNEERWLGETLRRLEGQTYQDFEVILVDSGSTDESLEIARQFPRVKIIDLKPEEFTYPYAINLGIQASTAASYIAILSAHSLPIGRDWLQSAVIAISSDDNAMGVYGPLKAMPDGSFTDKLIHNIAFWREQRKATGRTRILNAYEGGALGFTNALIRRDLWEQQPIDERYAGGGEDTVWMQYWLQQGYHAIKHLDFAVHHSHYLGPIGWYKQWQHWKKNATPQPFTHLKYRHDAAHAALSKK